MKDVNNRKELEDLVLYLMGFESFMKDHIEMLEDDIEYFEEICQNGDYLYNSRDIKSLGSQVFRVNFFKGILDRLSNVKISTTNEFFPEELELVETESAVITEEFLEKIKKE